MCERRVDYRPSYAGVTTAQHESAEDENGQDSPPTFDVCLVLAVEAEILCSDANDLLDEESQRGDKEQHVKWLTRTAAAVAERPTPSVVTAAAASGSPMSVLADRFLRQNDAAQTRC